MKFEFKLLSTTSYVPNIHNIIEKELKKYFSDISITCTQSHYTVNVYCTDFNTYDYHDWKVVVTVSKLISEPFGFYKCFVAI